MQTVHRQRVVLQGYHKGLTNLRQECRKVKGVPVHDDPPDISYNRGNTARDDAPRKEPLAPSEPEVRVQDSRDGVQCYEDDVGRERRPVAVNGGLDGAEVEGAV